jgi:hypothetical protein
MARAEQLWAANGDAEAPVSEARRQWGYGPKSSGFVQTEAALKQFELLEVSGRGEGKKVRLSPLATRLLADPRPNPEERRKLLERAALAPEIHRVLYERWGTSRLPAEEAKRFLMTERGFNAKGADDLIREYQTSLAHAGLLDSPVAADRRSDSSTGSPAVGTAPAEMRAVLKENEMKVMIDGQHITVSARVDHQGLRKLIKILQANGALLQDAKKGR